MKLNTNGEYLTPDFEVITMTFAETICTSSQIPGSGEKDEIGW